MVEPSAAGCWVFAAFSIDRPCADLPDPELPMSRVFRLAAKVATLVALVSLPANAQSLNEMAGQMIMVGFAGNSATDASVKAVAKEIAAGDLGGVMFLKTNVASKKAVIAMNAAFRAASPDLPPFISLDQEGGAVERLTSAVGFAAECPERAILLLPIRPMQQSRSTKSRQPVSPRGASTSISRLSFELVDQP